MKWFSLLFTCFFSLGIHGLYSRSGFELLSKYPNDLESQVAHTSKGQIEYVLKGSGPVVLSLHGGFGGYEQSYLIAESLIKKGFSVLAVSRPGYLRSKLLKGKNDSDALQADAMAALLDTLGIKKVCALGFSAGSSVAFQFALRHPERTWSLVLESIAAQPEDFPIPAIIRTMEKSNFAIGKNSNFAKSLAQKILPLDVDDTLSKKMLKKRADFVSKNKKQLLFLQKFLQTCEPTHEKKAGIKNDGDCNDPWLGYNYKKLRVKTIIIQSIHDGSGSYEEVVKMVHKKMKDATLISLKNSGHFIWFGKQAKKWQKTLVKFLKENQPNQKN